MTVPVPVKIRAYGNWAPRRGVLAAVSVVLALLASPAHAVVISSTTANNTRPGDDPGWDYVGSRNNSSAVYLGDGWAITANHVGPGTITLPGGDFPAIPGTTVRLFNPAGSGLTTFTDLVMFRVSGDPGLAPLEIVSTPVPLNRSVMMIGHGRSREDSLTYWDLTPNGAETTWTIGDPPGDQVGFQTVGNNNQTRWGTNRVEVASSVVTNIDNHGHVVSLYTDFDQSGGELFEAQAVPDDSGGGVFFKDNDQWLLAGIMHATGNFDGQPQATAVFGDLTYFADLSIYRDQILSIIERPAPDTTKPWQNPMNRLDVDNNGSVDLGDASAVSIALDLQFSQIADASGVLNPPTLATLPPWVDVNGDNILAPRDALSVMWNVRYGALPDSAAADALASGPLTAGLVVTAAPEPGGLTLEASGLAILLATFCRRKRRETRNLGGI